MWSIHFIIIAAIANALMDSVETSIAFRKSIFKNRNPKWWNKEVSHLYVGFLPHTKYRPDAWHLAKSTMIFFLILAIVVYSPIFSQLYCLFIESDFWSNFLGAVSDLIFYGIFWNIAFNTFYNKVFR
jgi:hypothetical protein